jgi:lysophospholipase L1-like esterase
MHTIIKYGFIALLLALYCIAGAEVYLRIFAPQAKTPRYVVAGPLGVRANEANREYYHKTAEYRVRFKINSEGMRADKEFAKEKPAGTKRILVLGDSFGIGYGADLEDTFLAVMQRELEEAGHNVELINLSVSGLGPSEQLIQLRETGLAYDPDLVLQCWNITDVNDNIRAKLFELEDGELVQRNDSYLPATRAQEMLGNIGIFRWLSAHSDLFGFLRENAGEWAKKLLFVMRGGANNAEADDEIETETNDTPDESQPDTLTGPQELAIAILKTMQQESAEAGANFVVCDVPAHWNRYNYWSTFPVDPDGDDFGFHIQSPLETFDSLKADQVRGYPGEKLYWEHSRGHFSPKGNQIVGEELAAYILEHDLLNETTEQAAAKASATTKQEAKAND